MDSLVQRLGGCKLQNFLDTRFCYIRDTCERISKALIVMQKVAIIEDDTLSDNVMETIFDAEFKNELAVIGKNLTPIYVLINKCQDPAVNVADATEMWLSLELLTHEYNNVIRDRIKKAVHPIGYAAYLLHPKYKVTLLSDDQMESAITFLTDNMSRDEFNELKIYLPDVEKMERIIR